MKLQIDDPCHENWDDMTRQEKGRFCNSCQKLVLDMTHYSDKEIISFFKNKEYDVCGQFRDDQLDRKLIWNTENKPKLLSKGLVAASFAAAMLVPGSLQSSEPVQINTETNSTEEEESPIHPGLHLLFDTGLVFIFKGRVLDQDGKPVKGIKVSIKEYETITNKKGEYQLSIGVTSKEEMKGDIYFSGDEYLTITEAYDLAKDQPNVDMGTTTIKHHSCIRKGKVKVR